MTSRPRKQTAYYYYGHGYYITITITRTVIVTLTILIFPSLFWFKVLVSNGLVALRPLLWDLSESTRRVLGFPKP